MSTLTHMQVEEMVASLFSLAILCKISNDDLYHRYNSLPVFSKYNGKGRYKHPAYLRQYARGAFAALGRRMYQENLEFCYRDNDGVLYSTHRDSTHRKTREWYDRGEGYLLGKLPSGHYWKGTDKLFYGDKGE